MKKLILGLIVSGVFIYFSIRGVAFGEILAEFENVRYVFLVPAIILILSLSVLRSIRWGVILSPIEKIRQKSLFPINCIGIMAIIIFPLRMGEFLRPYLVSKKSQISMSSALATILVERVLDVLTLMGILILVVFSVTVPVWIARSGYSILVIFVILLFSICFLYFNTEAALKLLRPLLSRFSQKLQMRIEKFLRTFVDGFAIIASPKRLISTVFLSIMIWGCSGLAVYSLFYFQNLHLSLISAFAVLSITALGISLPAAPGLLGNFQFGCIVALSIFGLSKSNALAFSMVYYFAGVGINILLGLLFLPFMTISIKEAKRGFDYVSLREKTNMYGGSETN